MKILRPRWYGFSDKAVADRFGACTYLGDVCIAGESQPTSMFRAHSPDRSKGHKKYFGLLIVRQWENVAGLPPSLFDPSERKMLIRGFSPQKALKLLTNITGVFCSYCDTAVYSPERHTTMNCTCEAITVDGGDSYCQITYNKKNAPKFAHMATIDLFRGKVRYRKMSMADTTVRAS